MDQGCESGGGLRDGRKREHRYSAIRIREWMGGRGGGRGEKSEVDTGEWDGESGTVRREGLRRDKSGRSEKGSG